MDKPHERLSLQLIKFLICKRRRLHIRASKSGSIYIQIEGQGLVRVSDHHLKHKHEGNKFDLVCKDTSQIQGCLNIIKEFINKPKTVT